MSTIVWALTWIWKINRRHPPQGLPVTQHWKALDEWSVARFRTVDHNFQSKIHHGIGASSYITNASASSNDANPMLFALTSSSLNNPGQLGPIAQAEAHKVEGYALDDGTQNGHFTIIRIPFRTRRLKVELGRGRTRSQQLPTMATWWALVCPPSFRSALCCLFSVVTRSGYIEFSSQPSIDTISSYPCAHIVMNAQRPGLARSTKNDNMKEASLEWQGTCESEQDREQRRGARKDSHRLKRVVPSNLLPSSKSPASTLLTTRVS
ncbi:hypothetical protein IW262DRAFT_577248 [Armillaria fumosa]|nr:hypothetical protein IW262DRAFT_577248 [Armillaria fumosa]